MFPISVTFEYKRLGGLIMELRLQLVPVCITATLAPITLDEPLQ